LYRQNLLNFESGRYWFDHLSDSEISKRLFGTDPREEEVKRIFALQYHNGTMAELEAAPEDFNVFRRKRATVLLPPECVNLPTYKNWVEEGRLAPVQDQGGCGKV
jgi:hypothetical protein